MLPQDGQALLRQAAKGRVIFFSENKQYPGAGHTKQTEGRGT